jgi:very-short-patch-repair endonuclease
VPHRLPRLNSQADLVGGIRVVGLAEAVVDSWRILDRGAAMSLVSWIVTRRPISADALAIAATSRRGRRGAIQMWQCLDLVNADAASILELEAQRFLREAGIQGWKANVPIRARGRILFCADIFFPAAGLILEVDGFTTHSDRASFESDRVRDSRAAALGLVTVRITHKDLFENRDDLRQRILATFVRLTSSARHPAKER